MSDINPTDIFNQYQNGTVSKIDTINKLVSFLKKIKDVILKSEIFDVLIKIIQSENLKIVNLINDKVSLKFKKLQLYPRESIVLGLLEIYLNIQFSDLAGRERISSLDNGFVSKDGHITYLIIHSYENYDELNFQFLDYLERLTLTIKGLKIIKGLESKKHLKWLTILNSKLEELRGAESLINLETLIISGVKSSEIKGLNELKNLKNLHIWGSLTEIPRIINLSKLVKLNLSQNEIKEITGLDNLSNLKSLNLSFNKIRELRGLNNLVNLETLILSKNLITEIKGIEHLIKLKTLILDDNEIKEIDGLATLINLKKINLDGNPLSNEELTLLKNKNDAQNIVKWCQLLKKPTCFPKEIYDNFKKDLISMESAIHDLQILLENSPFDNIRMNSIKFLGKINDKSNKIFDTLENILVSDSNEEIRSVAAQEIVNNFLNMSKELIIHTIKNEESIEVIISLYNALKKIDSKKSEQLIEEIAKILGKENKLKYDIDLTEAMGLKFLERITGVKAVEGGYMDYDVLSFGVGNNHITYLDIHEVRCQKLTFLELFPHLHSLEVAGTELREIAGLEDLINLRSLQLRGIQLTEIPGLGILKSLERLDLLYARITNLDGIEALKNLVEANFEEINMSEPDLDRIYKHVEKNRERIEEEKQNLIHFAEHHKEQSKIDKALELYDSALKISSTIHPIGYDRHRLLDIEEWYNLAKIFLIKENYDKALDACIQAIKLNSHHEGAQKLRKKLTDLIKEDRQRKNIIKNYKKLPRSEKKALISLEQIIGKRIYFIRSFKGFRSNLGAIVKDGHITHLNLSSCQLLKFPKEILSFTCIKQLNLSDNQIDNLPKNLKWPDSLTLLNLSGNSLVNLPRSIRFASSLKVLDLSNNKLTDFPMFTRKYESFKSLRDLNLVGNKIPKEKIQKLKKAFEGKVQLRNKT